jgi:hypothetical protein
MNTPIPDGLVVSTTTQVATIIAAITEEISNEITHHFQQHKVKKLISSQAQITIREEATLSKSDYDGIVNRILSIHVITLIKTMYAVNRLACIAIACRVFADVHDKPPAEFRGKMEQLIEDYIATQKE